MNIVIQHCRTGAYWAPTGWAAEREKGLTFSSSLQALDYCFQRGLQKDVRLVLQFSNPEFDVELDFLSAPVPEERLRRQAN